MNVQIYKCFIASPSDTILERGICDKVFNEINKSLGEIYNFRIESLKWENDVRPSFGVDGQDVINKQIGNSYDLFIGIMYKKFGTPTSRAESGTEEEFNIAYQRYVDNNLSEIMMYFNNKAPESLSDINISEYQKVDSFKEKVSKAGGLYHQYSGAEEFTNSLRKHLQQYFIDLYKKKGLIHNDDHLEILKADAAIELLFKKRLDDALSMFTTQPIIWVDPVVSLTNEISQNPDDNYNDKIDLESIIKKPEDTIVKAPPQFGLTSLALHLCIKAWENGALWIYVNAEETKHHNIQNYVKKETEFIKKKITDVKCIILDDWTGTDSSSKKKLKQLCVSYPEVPIFVMQRIDDSNFLSDDLDSSIVIDR